MNTNHLLSGTLPGLLQECSPVMLTKPYESIPTLGVGRPGVVMRVITEENLLHVAWSSGEIQPVPPEHLALRLDNQTGLAHLAWWLRARLVKAKVMNKLEHLCYPLACAESAWPMDNEDLETLKKVALEYAP